MLYSKYYTGIKKAKEELDENWMSPFQLGPEPENGHLTVEYKVGSTLALKFILDLSRERGLDVPGILASKLYSEAWEASKELLQNIACDFYRNKYNKSK